MSLTTARQRNGVSEGIALGVLLHGETELPSDKMALDLAFEGAFRDWQYKHQFPQVQTDLRNGSDASNVMLRADVDKHTFAAYWVRDGRRVRIETRDPDWSAGKPEDVEFAVSMVDGDVPGDGWRALAGDLLRRLSR